MNGIVISIDPVIFRLGNFALLWYSLMIMLAIVAAAFIATNQAKKKGIAAEAIYSLLPWILIGGIIGARLFHVIDLWEYYAANPLLIPQFQQGGLAIWGALAGGVAAAIIYVRIKHLPLRRLGDIMTPALLTAHIIGRVGCIINGDAYGGITGLPWGFIYTHPDVLIPPSLFGVPTHPYPAYEIIWNGLALLLIMKMRPHLNKDGLLFLSYLSLYSLGRFALTFVRQERIWFWGLQEAQVLSVVIFIIAVTTLIYRLRRGNEDGVRGDERTGKGGDEDGKGPGLRHGSE